MPGLNSFNSVLHSVKLLLKQTTVTEREWKLLCKYSSVSLHALAPQIQSLCEQLPTRKMAVKTKNRLRWYLVFHREETQ